MLPISDALKNVDLLKDEMVNSLANICKIPAVGPESDGQGEYEKAKFIEELLNEIGFDEIKWYNAKDKRVETGIRPNIVAKLYGETEETIWIVSHMDIVPTGDLNDWDTNPFEPVIIDERLYGRGVEDNGQELIASLYAVKALKELGIKPKKTIALVFVADEETGSKLGIQYLLTQDIFNKNDLYIVPDFGCPAGNEIEIAEKNILWLKVTTHGKQSHASTPDDGNNAMRAAAKFMLEVDKELHKIFSERDSLYSPPYSTFEPTKKENNVPNVNTIPGIDIFYIDCRFLPNYKIDDVVIEVKNTAGKIAKETDTKIEIEVVQQNSSLPTSKDSKVVKELMKAIDTALGIKPKLIGIGGGTCAAFFRNNGFDAAVWNTCEEFAHQANENIKIDNLVKDAKVYLTVFMQ